MTAEDEVLLNNLLDALDRLYDQECGAMDVECLVASTIIGLRDPEWLPVLLRAKQNIRAAVHADWPDEGAVNSETLEPTAELRMPRAEWYSEDRVTMWTYGGFAR